MAEFFNKANVAVAVGKRNSFDLSCQHLQTASPMQFNVAYCRELMPSSSIKVNHKTFARTTALYKPTLGSMQLHNRAFFVPFRTVWEPFSDFITDVPHAVGSEGVQILSNVPQLRMHELIVLFVGAGNVDTDYAVRVTDASVAYDFVYNATHYKYTVVGRQTMKILQSLGYKVLWTSKHNDMFFSALPLLCLAKLFIDWYYPSQYAHRGAFAVIDGITHRQYTYNLTIDELRVIIPSILSVYYDSDYFTSAWDSPLSPGGTGIYETGSVDFSIKDITMPEDSRADVVNQTGDSPNGTPHLVLNDGSSPSQYSLDSLKALTDYIKRHQLVGSRAMDRYLARYGLQLQADKLRRSYYLGSEDFPLQIGEVQSNAATSEAALGEYAGRAVAYSGDGNFEFDTDEFGYFFIINTIQPDISYYQGVDRNVMHLSKLDFFTPEFDQLGVQAISVGELVVSPKNERFNEKALDTIFGYTGRYAEYKVAQDRMTGDFVYDSVNAGLFPWSTAREFDTDGKLPNDFVHSLAFVSGDDANQYRRIFYGFEDGDVTDNIYLVHRTNVKLTIPARSLFDSYDFDTDSGRKVTVDANGVKMN